MYGKVLSRSFVICFYVMGPRKQFAMIIQWVVSFDIKRKKRADMSDSIFSIAVSFLFRWWREWFHIAIRKYEMYWTWETLNFSPVFFFMRYLIIINGIGEWRFDCNWWDNVCMYLGVAFIYAQLVFTSVTSWEVLKQGR